MVKADARNKTDGRKDPGVGCGAVPHVEAGTTVPMLTLPSWMVTTSGRPPNTRARSASTGISG